MTAAAIFEYWINQSDPFQNCFTTEIFKFQHFDLKTSLFDEKLVLEQRWHILTVMSKIKRLVYNRTMYRTKFCYQRGCYCTESSNMNVGFKQ